MTTFRAGAATDAGLIRRTNQDQLLLGDDLFAVADGMGGHAGGEVASRTAIETLRATFESRSNERGAATCEDLRESVRAANAAVFEQAQAGDDLRGMGTTMTAAALVQEDGEDRLAIANVGDSRAYVFAVGELTQLTEDHSVPEELVRQGQLAPEEAAAHPQRHMLTRVLGVFPEVEIDVWQVVPLAGDRLLLCSDGLCRELTDEQIASVLRRLAQPDEAARELIARARASGGSDNITAVIVDVVDDGGRAETASRELAAERTVASPARPEMPDDEAEESGGRGRARTRRHAPPRRITFRVVGFFVLLLVLLGVAAGAVAWFARGSYYVGLGSAAAAVRCPTTSPCTSAQPIVIYQGRPGGLLWFRPTVAERTGKTTADVLPFRVADLKSGKIEASLGAARAYVHNLLGEASAVRAPGGSTSTLPPLPPAPATATTR